MEGHQPLLNTIIESIQEKKGKKIVTADLTEIESASTQFFIICEGSSTTQVDTIANSVRDLVQKELGIKPYGYDGYQNSQWIVIDYGNLFVHVFLPEQRDFYKLERLWSDATLKQIPDLD